MAIKITNPGVLSLPQAPALAGGSFELYAQSTAQRRYAYLNANFSQPAPYQNSFDANGHPIDHLWVENDSLDVVFRDRDGNELGRRPLAECITQIDSMSYTSSLLQLTAEGEQPGVAPAQITDLAASLSGTTATLTWTANGGVVSVYRRNVSIGGKFVSVASSIAGDATSYQDEHLSLSTQYEWRIVASNADGFSVPSNVVTLTTANPISLPALISDLAASGITGGETTLTWTPNGGTIDLYRRNVSLLGPYVKVKAGISGAASSTTDTGLESGTFYEWVVTATNSRGTSGFSNVAFSNAPADVGYSYLQPLQDKTGVWIDNAGTWAPETPEPPESLVAGYYFNAGDTMAPVINGFSWETTTNDIEEPAGQTEAGVRFTWPGEPDPREDSTFERRCAFDEQDTVYFRMRFFVPENYFHRSCVVIRLTGDMSSWQVGDTVVAADGTSEGTIYWIDTTTNQDVWLLFADNSLYGDGVWTGNVTNSTRSSTLASTRIGQEASNNKVMAIWCDGPEPGDEYSNNGASPTVVYEMESDGQGGSRLYYHFGADNQVVGTLPNSTSAQVDFIRPQDAGTWMELVVGLTHATSEAAADGVIETYLKRDAEPSFTRVHQQTNALIGPRAAAQNAKFQAAYLWGYWNSGVQNTTYIHVSEAELHNAKPTILGA